MQIPWRRPCGRFSCGRVGRTAAVGLAVPLLLAAGAPTPLASVDAQRQARAVDRDAARSGAKDAAAQVRKLQAQLVGLGQAESDGRQRVGGARERLRQLNLQEAALKVRMGRNQESLTRMLGALQMFQRNPPPALLVDPHSARDAVRAAILIKAITPALEQRARDFTAQSAALKRIRRQSDAASGDLFQAESTVADRQAQIEDLIEQKRALEKQLNADASLAAADVQRLAARARSLGELVHTLSAHDGVAATYEAEIPARFVVPVQGALTRGYGQAAIDAEHAKGLTWSADPNATVRSPMAAAVDYAGPLKGWGLVLILRAGDYHLVMAGLGAVSAEAGRTVAAGEPVGTMPGDASRPELYLEVRQATRPVDPSRWFAGGPAPPGSGQPGRG